MKKRSVIIIASLIILIGAGVLVSILFGIKTEKEIVVSAPIVGVSRELTNLKDWPNWFAGADKCSFEVIDSNPAGVTVRTRRGSVQSIYVIAAYPDSKPSTTHIQWTTVESGLDWLKQKMQRTDDDPETRLMELKHYFESAKAFYGFDIRVEQVLDSLVLTKEEMIKESEVATSLRKMFRELEDFAGKEHLKTNIDSCRMATFYDERRDSVDIAAGIPVSERVSGAKGGIRLLEMPAHGKMLVGRYQGPYNGISGLYHAMRQYVFDKKLKVIGAVYEKYLSKSNSASDSSNMTIELHFPIL